MDCTLARPARLIVLLACLAVLGAVPATASADVRVGQASDLADQIPDVSGPSKTPDFEQVRVRFDQATGAVTATVRFYQPIDTTSPGHRLQVGIGSPTIGGLCNPGDVLMGADVAATATQSTFAVARFTGSGTGTLAVSPDKRELTLAFSSPTIVKADLRCFNAYTITYDDIGHCGNPECTFFSHTFVHDTVETAFFDGYTPAPVVVPQIPTCRDGIDNDHDGRIDFDQDPGCRGDATANSEADPAAVASKVALSARRSGCGIDVKLAVQPVLKPADLYTFGRVAVSVRGVSGAARGYAKTRRVTLGDPEGYRFGALKKGRYRVSASYAGDKWRKASAAPRRLVTVKARGCRG